jgi:hypothetical protein
VSPKISPINSAIAGETKPVAARITPAKNMALFTARVSHATSLASKKQLPKWCAMRQRRLALRDVD